MQFENSMKNSIKVQFRNVLMRGIKMHFNSCYSFSSRSTDISVSDKDEVLLNCSRFSFLMYASLLSLSLSLSLSSLSLSPLSSLSLSPLSLTPLSLCFVFPFFGLNL